MIEIPVGIVSTSFRIKQCKVFDGSRDIYLVHSFANYPVCFDSTRKKLLFSFKYIISNKRKKSRLKMLENFNNFEKDWALYRQNSEIALD